MAEQPKSEFYNDLKFEVLTRVFEAEPPTVAELVKHVYSLPIGTVEQLHKIFDSLEMAAMVSKTRTEDDLILKAMNDVGRTITHIYDGKLTYEYMRCAERIMLMRLPK